MSGPASVVAGPSLSSCLQGAGIEVVVLTPNLDRSPDPILISELVTSEQSGSKGPDIVAVDTMGDKVVCALLLALSSSASTSMEFSPSSSSSLVISPPSIMWVLLLPTQSWELARVEARMRW